LFDAHDKSRGGAFRSAFLGRYRGLARLNSTFVVGILFCILTLPPAPGRPRMKWPHRAHVIARSAATWQSQPWELTVPSADHNRPPGTYCLLLTDQDSLFTCSHRSDSCIAILQRVPPAVKQNSARQDFSFAAGTTEPRSNLWANRLAAIGLENVPRTVRFASTRGNRYGVPNGGPLSNAIASSCVFCRLSASMTEIACKYGFLPFLAVGVPGTDPNARSHRCGYRLSTNSLTDRHSMVSPEFPFARSVNKPGISPVRTDRLAHSAHAPH
jgi:hypothetical protein